MYLCFLGILRQTTMISIRSITSFFCVMVRWCVDSGLVGLLWLIFVLQTVVNYGVNHKRCFF